MRDCAEDNRFTLSQDYHGASPSFRERQLQLPVLYSSIANTTLSCRATLKNPRLDTMQNTKLDVVGAMLAMQKLFSIQLDITSSPPKHYPETCPKPTQAHALETSEVHSDPVPIDATLFANPVPNPTQLSHNGRDHANVPITRKI